MKKTHFITLLLCLFSHSLLAQEVYGVFSLPPGTNPGEKQIGTLDPVSGSIDLLGTNTSVETGTLAMTTGATALNVADNKSYFVARDASNVDRIYTVDLDTGITDSNPVLTAGYTTSNNWGVWYDEPNATLYGLFDNVNASGQVEISIINPVTGVVSTQHDSVVASGVGLASGLLTGDSANNRLFFLADGEMYVVSTSSPNSAYFFDFAGEVNSSYITSKVYGLEWDKDDNALWILFNEDLGNRKLGKVMGEDNFNEFDEPFNELTITLDNDNAITTASGLSALDVQSDLFFFIGRPSTGTHANMWSLYTVDLVNETSSTANIENPSQVQTNGYAGIEVLPGPELTFSKSDGDFTDKVPGDTITYTLDYSNAAGAGATSGLKITETVPAETVFLPGSSSLGWSCLPGNNAGASCELTLAELGPGDSGSATFSVQVNDYVSAGLSQITNNASLSADNTISAVMASDNTPITAAVELAVTKTDNDLSNAEPGDTVVYDLTASNTGDRVATNVVLTETVPVHTTYIPTAPYTWVCPSGNTAGETCTTVATDIGDTGFSTQFHVQVIDSVPAGTTEISNTVTISADNGPSDQASDNTPITSSATLTLGKTDGDASVAPGTSVVYQINYGNSGNQNADTVVLTETVLMGTEFDAGASTAGWTCTPDITEGSTCTFNLGTVPGGTSSSVNFALALNSPVEANYLALSNTVNMDASNATQATAQDSTPIDADVNLRLVKTDGGITAALGKVINYTLINFNDGNRDATMVQLTETVPDNTTFYSPSSTSGWTCLPDNSAGSTCTFDMPDLPGDGGKDTVFFAVKVDIELDPGVLELSNTATISALNAVSDSEDTELTPVDQIIPSVTLIDAVPSITEIASCSTNSAQINEIIVSFTDDQPGLIGFDNSLNYALIDTGMDQDLQTMSCDSVLGDDSLVNVTTFATGGTATQPNATLTLDETLTAGQYVMLICDDITDAAGNALDGDQDGIPGGHLQRQFRIEFDNLFNNAFFDDCEDNPVSLNAWNVYTDPGDIVAPVSSSDFDDSSLSGAVYYQGNSGSEIGLEQCVNLTEPGSHTLSASVLGVPSQNWNVYLYMTCGFYSLPDCNNIINDPHFETFTLSPSLTPEWQNINSLMLLPENAVSASCFAMMVEPNSFSFEYYVDELSMTYSDLIFADGFDAE